MVKIIVLGFVSGSKNDGSSFHFFHKTINAYATGHRKRRKVDCHRSLAAEHVRWHKTGKTKPIMENGVQKGCKKIMVLYKSSKKGSKADKSNWVMHQYHLGTEDGEKEGEYVVSKIFYQQHKQSETNDNNLVIEDDVNALGTSPRTPITSAPNPPRPGNSVGCDDVPDEDMLHSSAKVGQLLYASLCCVSVIFYIPHWLTFYQDPAYKKKKEPYCCKQKREYDNS